MIKSKTQRLFLIANTLMLWFALVLQFVISTNQYQAQGRSFGGALIQILSYYTIQTNLLIAVAMTSIWLFPTSNLGRFFSKTSVLTAIAVYILIVGLIYATVLKGIWQLTGLFKLTDVLLHELSPVTYLLFWFFVVPKESLRWSLLFPWAVFPLTYLFYALCRGAYTGDYPYPFVNAAKFGYPQVAVNAFFVLLIFTVLGSLLIGISRRLAFRHVSR